MTSTYSGWTRNRQIDKDLAPAQRPNLLQALLAAMREMDPIWAPPVDNNRVFCDENKILYIIPTLLRCPKSLSLR